MDYFQHPGVSSTALKHMHITPAHYVSYIKSQQDEHEKAALRMGTAVHHKILDVDLPNRIKLFNMTKTFNSKAGDAFLEEHGKNWICLSEEEHEHVMGMTKAIWAESRIMKLIRAAKTEVEIYGKEITPYGEVQTKAKPDVLGNGYIMDIKTTGDMAYNFPRKFRWAPLFYQVQAAWYEHMAYTHVDAQRRDFYWIVVESKPPYGVKLFQAKPETMAEGKMMYEKALEIYAKALHEGQWPGYNNDYIEAI